VPVPLTYLTRCKRYSVVIVWGVLYALHSVRLFLSYSLMQYVVFFKFRVVGPFLFVISCRLQLSFYSECTDSVLTYAPDRLA
jgi:hypothetical protein